MKTLASENRRYGYLRLHALLRREGLVTNHKRTYRLYSEQGLQVRTTRRRKLPRRERIAPQVPERPMQRWSLDFMSDQLADHRRFRVLNVVDDHSRFCPGRIVDVSISGARVACHLDEPALRFGLPEEIVLDNGPRVPARRCSTGPSAQASVCASSSPASRCRTPSSRASTASSGTSASICTGSGRCTMRARRSAAGAATTTPCARIRRSTTCHQRSSMTTTAAPALETLAVSALPLNTHTRPGDSGSTRP